MTSECREIGLSNRIAFRFTNKSFGKLFYILAVLWLVAFLLLRVVTVSPNVTSPMITLKRKNVFEEFNNEIRLLELNDPENKEEVLHEDTSLGKLRIDPNPLYPDVDCEAIVKGDADVIEQTALKNLEFKSKLYERQRAGVSKCDETLRTGLRNCSHFTQHRKYFGRALTKEEEAFPIAYVIAIHKKFWMFERLLRSIYHPQNIYCIHVDKKASQEFIEDIRNLTNCFDNVFVASKLTKVYYTHWSRVQADLNCLHDLNNKRSIVPWKYVINLCGQDFPLKTNFEIVRSLKSLFGYNNLETFVAPSHKKPRYENEFAIPTKETEYGKVQKTGKKKSPSPLETPMFSGSAYFIWTWQAVNFMITDPKVTAFFEWNKDTYSPDEHMWATLQRMYPVLPGSYPPNVKYDHNEMESITRIVKWGGLDDVYPKCAGVYSRGVCVYGVGDLPWLLRQHHLFANKFDENVDYYAIECLDIWLRNRTLAQTARYNKDGYL